MRCASMTTVYNNVCRWKTSTRVPKKNYFYCLPVEINLKFPIF